MEKTRFQNALLLLVGVSILLSTPVLAQSSLLLEDFSGGLPAGWQQFTGSSNVQNAVLELDTGCLVIPGTFDRSNGLRVEADINITNGGVGDFNFFVFFDPFNPAAPHCFFPATDGYDFAYYPAGSDNTFDAIRSTVSGNRLDIVTGPTSLFANAWHHASAELLSDGTLNHFIDGDLQLSIANADHSSGPIVLRTWRRVLIDNLRISSLCSYGPAQQPIVLERAKGKPSWETIEWESCGGPGILVIQSDRVSAALVYLNGDLVFGPSDFNANTQTLEAPVVLDEGTNFLDVQLRGKPGGSLTVELIQ